MARRNNQGGPLDAPNFNGSTEWFTCLPSSNVHSAKRVGNNLHVRFLNNTKTAPGSTYTYYGAGPRLGELIRAPSRGKFVRRVLIPEYFAAKL